jgi:Interferon-induced transmembrane protein
MAPPIQTYLVPAILVTLFCFFPTGIAAIVFAAQVSSKRDAGDYIGAARASKQGHGKVAFMQPEAALACAVGRGGGDGWPLLCCRGRPGAGD